MREIKFRAWWPGVKRMKFFVMGNFEDTPEGWAMTFVQENEPYSIFLGKAELMQFTGLKDKNGKDIYEGDICKTYNIGEPSELLDTVVFDDGSFVFQCDYKLSIELRGFKQDYIEVIGNIYENPELLQ